MKNPRTRLIVGTIVSLVLLAWVLWRTDWAEVAERLREADLLMLLAAFVLIAFSVALRAWRWGMMLEPEDAQRPYGTLFDIVNLGYFANNLLPARLGDLLRAYLAGQWTGASFSFALSTTVVERVLDTLIVVLMIFGLLPFLPVPPLAARSGALIGIVFLLGTLLLVVAAWQRASSERLIRLLLRPLPLDAELWSARLVRLLDGFALVRQPARFARVLFASVFVWGTAISSYWFTFHAFELAGLGFSSAAFTVSLAALGMAAPSGPASAGTFDAAAAGALVVLGVSSGLAGGIAVILHAINFLAVTALGLITMGRRGVSLSGLTRRAQEVKQLNVGSVE
ncbi:MAG: lysylphosphatidylglycerol synthase transmembrane domain-containing protein [Ardenticatenaceae bacterium]